MELQALLVALLSPMVLAFVLGIVATMIKSDLKFPEELYTSLTIYLLIAIGIKGGYKLSITPFQEIVFPAIAALILGIVIPIWSYQLLRHLGKFEIADAAALAAHYGSVSAVTFAEALAFHDNLKAAFLQQNPAMTDEMLKASGALYEGFMPGLLTIMEFPAIIIAILTARIALKKTDGKSQSVDASLTSVLKELIAGKSNYLMIGFLIIGLACGKRGWEQVSPFFDLPFRGILTLFLLEAGLVAGRRFSDLKKVGPFIFGFGIVMPILHAMLGIYLGKLAGLSLGGATILGVLAASASYIAAPAACRVALPQASPTLYLTASLAITFPFNIIVGLPLYHYFAKLLYHV
ncbi:MAG: sodium-dependent bicarbonate transport family permease [Chloroherpetonaceae bacterium]|nr:sodium-dependent bicarbonate transport family permease [Chloroherpetonaceae bacterium]